MIFRVLKCFCDIAVSHEQAVLKPLLQRKPVGFWVKEESFISKVFLFFVCVKMLDEIYSQIWSIVPYFCIKA